MKIRIRTQLVIYTLIITFLVAGALSLYAVVSRQRAIYHDFSTQGRVLSYVLSTNLIGPLNNRRIPAATLLLRTATKQTDIVAAYALDPDGHVLSDGTDDNPYRQMLVPTVKILGRVILNPRRTITQQHDEHLYINTPVRASTGKLVGYLHLDLTLARANIRAFDETLVLAAMTGGLFLLGGLLAIVLSKWFASPLGRMVKGTVALSRGNFHSRINIKRSDEFGELAQAINRMAENLGTTTVSKQYIDNIIRSMADALIVVDSNLLIETVNEAATELLEFNREELLGKPIHQIIRIDSKSPVTTETLSGWTMSQHVELDFIRKFGQCVPVSFSGSILKNEQGDIQGFVCVARDISALKVMQAELEKTRDSAVEAAKAKSQFLANMSHEIRTPMNGVLGMLEILNDTDLTDDQRDYLETAHGSAESLLRVINDILDFSKIEAGKMQIERIAFELREVVEEVGASLAEPAQAKNLELMCFMPLNIPSNLLGDPARLRQILMNLAGNAIKFTGQGEVFVRVNKKRDKQDSVILRFEVRDTGIGIPQQRQPELFDAFTQADGSTSRKFGGTGLGLTICKQLIEQMGGEIGVHSEEGKGSTFWFTLEYCKQKQTDFVVEKIKQDDLVGLRVLVVDDNETNRRILAHYLKSWRMEFESLPSAIGAVECMKRAVAMARPFHVVLLDMQMPEMDGITLARAIKAEPDLSKTRLVLLSSVGISQQDQYPEGIDASLNKPVRQSRLFDTIANVIGQWKPEQPKNNMPDSPLLKARILLAEDNPVNQKVALAMMKKLGLDITVATTGRAAVDAVLAKKFDAVFMDCQMPEMDGFEATHAIRDWEAKNDQGHRIIIAMTANAMEGDRQKCIDAGMDDYLAKPVNQASLRSMLERWLGDKSDIPATTSQLTSTGDNQASRLIDAIVFGKLRDLMGDDFPSLLDDYIKHSSSLMESIAQAIGENDTSEVHILAHSLKSSSQNVGAMSLSEMAQKLETMSKNNELFEAKPMLNTLGHAHQAVIKALESELTSLPKLEVD